MCDEHQHILEMSDQLQVLSICHMNLGERESKGQMTASSDNKRGRYGIKSLKII